MSAQLMYTVVTQAVDLNLVHGALGVLETATSVLFRLSGLGLVRLPTQSTSSSSSASLSSRPLVSTSENSEYENLASAAHDLCNEVRSVTAALADIDSVFCSNHKFMHLVDSKKPRLDGMWLIDPSGKNDLQEIEMKTFKSPLLFDKEDAKLEQTDGEDESGYPSSCTCPKSKLLLEVVRQLKEQLQSTFQLVIHVQDKIYNHKRSWWSYFPGYRTLDLGAEVCSMRRDAKKLASLTFRCSEALAWCKNLQIARSPTLL